MEEIRQKDWKEEFTQRFCYQKLPDETEYVLRPISGDRMLNIIQDILSQALQKQRGEIIKMLENTDVGMSVNGDVSKDEIAMAKFIYKAHIKHIIKKIESAIIPPNSINETLPSETDSTTK